MSTGPDGFLNMVEAGDSIFGSAGIVCRIGQPFGQRHMAGLRHEALEIGMVT